VNPVIIIPTYVGAKRKTAIYNVVATYDHTTPFTHQGELPRCLTSLRDNGVEIPVILLVVAETGVEREASVKIRDIATAFDETLDIRVIDAKIVADFHAHAEDLGISTIKEGISLVGYGATRNLGLVVAACLGYSELIFIDDDEVVTDHDFVERSLYGLGKITKKGIPILVKSGFFMDQQGRWKSQQSKAWYNRFWEQGPLFNKWITKAMTSPRLSRSNVLYGGLMALHREAFRRVCFDPWIPRGEDLDYLLNIQMYGGGVWFDNQWSILHMPPAARNGAQRFKQDVYRWIYEHRKLEFSKSQIDLLQIPPHSLDPYPGPFLENSITTRVFLTALLRTIGLSGDRKGYFSAARASRQEARAYAEMFCSKYFEFQLGWAQILGTLEVDSKLKALFGEASRVGPGPVRNYQSPLLENNYSQYDDQTSFTSQVRRAETDGFAVLASHASRISQTTQDPQSFPSDKFTQGSSASYASQKSDVSGFQSVGDDPASQGVEHIPELFDFELDLAALGIKLDED